MNPSPTLKKSKKIKEPQNESAALMSGKEMRDLIISKQQEAQQLAASIDLYSTKHLTRDQHEQCQALQWGEQYRLDALVQEFKIKELDIKIEAMKKIMQMLRA